MGVGGRRVPHACGEHYGEGVGVDGGGDGGGDTDGCVDGGGGSDDRFRAEVGILERVECHPQMAHHGRVWDATRTCGKVLQFGCVCGPSVWRDRKLHACHLAEVEAVQGEHMEGGADGTLAALLQVEDHCSSAGAARLVERVSSSNGCHALRYECGKAAIEPLDDCWGWGVLVVCLLLAVEFKSHRW